MNELDVVSVRPSAVKFKVYEPMVPITQSVEKVAIPDEAVTVVVTPSQNEPEPDAIDTEI